LRAWRRDKKVIKEFSKHKISDPGQAPNRPAIWSSR